MPTPRYSAEIEQHTYELRGGGALRGLHPGEVVVQDHRSAADLTLDTKMLALNTKVAALDAQMLALDAQLLALDARPDAEAGRYAGIWQYEGYTTDVNINVRIYASQPIRPIPSLPTYRPFHAYRALQ
jgi:hypothetical protein